MNLRLSKVTITADVLKYTENEKKRGREKSPNS